MLHVPLPTQEEQLAHYKIIWNCGYGDSWDFIEADTKEQADKMAYDAWLEDAQNNAEYHAEGPLEKPEDDEDHPDYKDDE